MKRTKSPSPGTPRSEDSPRESRLSFLSFYLLTMISGVMLTFAPGLAVGVALGTLILKTSTPKATASPSGSEIAIVALATRHVRPSIFEFSKVAPLDETTDAHVQGVCPAVTVPAPASVPMPQPGLHRLTAAFPAREMCLGSGRYGRAPPRVSTCKADFRVPSHANARMRATDASEPQAIASGVLYIARPKATLVLNERPSVRARDSHVQSDPAGRFRAAASRTAAPAAPADSPASNPLRI